MMPRLTGQTTHHPAGACATVAPRPGAHTYSCACRHDRDPEAGRYSLESEEGDLRGSRAGDLALSTGVVAGIATFVPVIGEVVALPAALLAIGFGAVGVRRYETGRSRRYGPAVAGIILGALAALGAFMVLASTGLLR